MIKHWQVFLVYLAAFLLQPFLQNLVPIIGNNVNLVLCLTVMLVFIDEDPGQGIFFGSIATLFTDLFYGAYTGPGVLAIALTGIAVYVLKYFVHVENFANAILFMIGTTLLYASLYWGIYAMIGTTYSYGYAISHIGLQFVMNTLVGLCAYFILLRKAIQHKRKDRYYR